jgi:O-antigen/teichoic acid export membrane protein
VFKRFSKGSQGQLQRNIFSGMISSGVGAVLMAASYPYYRSKLGYRTYGVWIALTIIISMSQLGNLGIAQALVKKIAEQWERKEYDDVARYYSTAVITLSAVAVLLFSVLFLAKEQILRMIGLSPSDASAYSSLATGIFVLSASTFVVDVVAIMLSGLGRVDLYNYCQMTVQVVSVMGSVALLSAHASLQSMLTAQISGYATGMIFALVTVRREVPFWPLNLHFYSFRHLRDLLGQGSMLMGAWVFSLLFHPANKIILGQAGYFSALPAYEIAVNLSMRLRNFFEAGQRALMPEASRLLGSASGDLSQLRNMLTAAVRNLVLMAGPVYLVVFALATPLTKIWLKHSFSPIVPGTLRIFLLGTFLSLVGTPFYYVLIGAGRAQGVLLANAFQFLLNIVGVYLALRIVHVPAGSALYVILGVADVALGVSTLVLLLATRHTFRNVLRPQLDLDAVVV